MATRTSASTFRFREYVIVDASGARVPDSDVEEIFGNDSPPALPALSDASHSWKQVNDVTISQTTTRTDNAF